MNTTSAIGSLCLHYCFNLDLMNAAFASTPGLGVPPPPSPLCASELRSGVNDFVGKSENQKKILKNKSERLTWNNVDAVIPSASFPPSSFPPGSRAQQSSRWTLVFFIWFVFFCFRLWAVLCLISLQWQHNFLQRINKVLFNSFFPWTESCSCSLLPVCRKVFAPNPKHSLEMYLVTLQRSLYSVLFGSKRQNSDSCRCEVIFLDCVHLRGREHVTITSSLSLQLNDVFSPLSCRWSGFREKPYWQEIIKRINLTFAWSKKS